MYYAQIRDETICYAILETPNEIIQSDMISIDSYDESLLGKFYNPETGVFEEIILSVDKQNIAADGVDSAMVTAQVPVVLTEVAFYNADTGDLIATQVVDPATHTATLQVTATTPGVIRIRVGQETRTRLNEVVINAV